MRNAFGRGGGKKNRTKQRGKRRDFDFSWRLRSNQSRKGSNCAVPINKVGRPWR